MKIGYTIDTDRFFYQKTLSFAEQYVFRKKQVRV